MVFKVFIEFVAVLLLFYVLVFWPRGILGSLTRDPITPALKGDVLATGMPRKSLTFNVLNCFSDLFEKFMNVCLVLLYTNSFLFPDRILSSLTLIFLVENNLRNVSLRVVVLFSIFTDLF